MDDAVTALNILLTRFVNDETNGMSKIKACMKQLEKNPQQILDRIKANTNESGCTAVHKAARGNMSIIIDHLFRHLDAEKKDELLQTRDNDGNSPIHEAVKNVNDRTLAGMLGVPQTIDETIKLLQMRNKEGDTPIHCAVRAGNEPSLEIMLQEVDQERINELLKIRNEQGETAVCVGIREGKMEIVRCMLERVVADDRVNLLRIKNVQGNALHYTAWAGHVLPYWLIDSGHHFFNLMEEKNESGQTPMHCAMSQGHASVVEAMLTVIRTSRRCYSETLIMGLLQNVDDNRDMPLHSAAAAGHMNAIGTALSFLCPDFQKSLLGMKSGRKETVVEVARATRDRLRGTIEMLNTYIDSTDDTTTSVQGGLQPAFDFLQPVAEEALPGT